MEGGSAKTQPFDHLPLRSHEESVVELEPVKCPMNAPDLRGRERWRIRYSVIVHRMNRKNRRAEVFGKVPYDFLMEADQADRCV